MDFFAQLRAAFSRLDRLEARLSEEWRKHTNRRTILILLLTSLVGYYTYAFHVQAPQDFPSGTLVTVDSGLTISQVAQSLHEQSVIRSPAVFTFLVLFFGREHVVHAGDYLFKKPTDVWTIARALSTGAYGLEPARMRILEGATTKEMAEYFAPRLQRFNTQSFLKSAVPLEGFLFPDTYYFLPNATDKNVIDAMRGNFEHQLEPYKQDFSSSTRSLHDIVTMASIVEREARNSADRRMIAGVLWNRIDKKMPLQVDAVFLYTLGKATFDLTVGDLHSDSPYNTYTHRGLPPTPIGSPSIDSILAALHPTASGYLYYLADKTGTTYFSKTYAEHLRKKHLYLGT